MDGPLFAVTFFAAVFFCFRIDSITGKGER